MGSPIAVYPQLIESEIEYPDSDGELMAESDYQLQPLVYTLTALRTHLQDRPDVYVAGNLLLYYEKGNPKAVVAPDVFVVIGAEKRERSSYLLWQEPKAPDFVLEITSKSTISQDQGVKRGLYAYLGVREYFQYDPTADYLEPPLQGLQLVGRNYVPIPVQTLPDGTLSLTSQVLGLALQLQGNEFRLFDPAAGEKLLTHAELEQARRAAEARIAELEARLQALESRPDHET